MRKYDLRSSVDHWERSITWHNVTCQQSIIALTKNWTNACARDWSRAADDDEDVDPCLSHPRPPPSNPDLCLSSALKSRTVAITLRTSGRFAASAAAYPTTRFLTRHLSTLPALWFEAELISSWMAIQQDLDFVKLIPMNWSTYGNFKAKCFVDTLDPHSIPCSTVKANPRKNLQDFQNKTYV